MDRIWLTKSAYLTYKVTLDYLSLYICTYSNNVCTSIQYGKRMATVYETENIPPFLWSLVSGTLLSDAGTSDDFN